LGPTAFFPQQINAAFESTHSRFIEQKDEEENGCDCFNIKSTCLNN